jgi:hypothetical protein
MDSLGAQVLGHQAGEEGNRQILPFCGLSVTRRWTAAIRSRSSYSTSRRMGGVRDGITDIRPVPTSADLGVHLIA